MARAVSRSNVAFLINKRVTANYFASCNKPTNEIIKVEGQAGLSEDNRWEGSRIGVETIKYPVKTEVNQWRSVIEK
jgi:hypothetical protein